MDEKTAVSHMVKAAYWRAGLIPLLLLGVVTACSNDNVGYNYPRQDANRPNPNPEGPRETVFGPGGVNFLNGLNGSDDGSGGGGAGIGVNSFLWRASLDTMSFMPLSSADPFGGVIITDWYSPPETPDERFKMSIYILDRRLRADGIRVAVFRQQRTTERGWVDASVKSETGIQLENAILTRARQLRLDTLQQ